MCAPEKVRAELIWKEQGGKFQAQITIPGAGKGKARLVSESEVDWRLKVGRFAGQKHEVEVVVDPKKGPLQARRLGEGFELNRPLSAPIRTPPPAPEPGGPRVVAPVEDAPMCHNPYNFVPAPDRGHLAAAESGALIAPLGDGQPIGHARYQRGYYSGRIPVRVAAVSPLAIPDASRATIVGEDRHRTYPLRLAPDGRPHLPATSVKGMLRSAYEAVTNSRLGVFGRRHQQCLAYRMLADEGLSVVPARVVNGGRTIRLMLGDTHGFPSRDAETGKWRIPDDLMYAAWLPYWFPVCDIRNQKTVKYTPYFTGPDSLRHGERVLLKLQRVWRRPFFYWRVIEVRVDSPGTAPIKLPSTDWRLSHQPMNEYCNNGKWLEGYVCITNHNTEHKHDERVFFAVQGRSLDVPLGPEHQRMWKELIDNYQLTHRDEIVEKRRNGPPASLLSRWSRHIVGKSPETPLEEGTLCYARVERADDGAVSVSALYPVMISRTLHDVSPASCLPKTVLPAASIAELSPADRVFGWVAQQTRNLGGSTQARAQGPSAYKGQLRIRRVDCVSAAGDAIEPFRYPGLPLAILGEPKPQQARFYMAGDATGGALPRSGSAIYEGGRGLRGRKVYPHHQGLDDGYWDPATVGGAPRPADGRCREYARPGRRTDDQNRSIQGWVRRGTTFYLEIDVVNLSRVELGGLLYLLSLPAKHFHRLGGGKPLGLGSVRLEIGDARLPANQAENVWPLEVYDGAVYREWLGSLDHDRQQFRRHNGLSRECVQALIDDFRRAVVEAYHPAPRPGSAELADASVLDRAFGAVPFISAFLKAAKGFDDGLPVHYPRARQDGQPERVTLPPHPDGLGYEWFEANKERGYVLEDLVDDRGLPYLKAKSRSR